MSDKKKLLIEVTEENEKAIREFLKKRAEEEVKQ
jgi:hypothetical protein